ncbi:MAG TPA: DUF308 domain-containing protein [Solirubrobacteraceae bacterium]|jgi:uncharacterized membrane protein HdeD (DUF308 family)|nr:DUF308 domain-containing protein [Solirubrobacteraceae bacterium]
MSTHAFISPDGAPEAQEPPGWAWLILLLVALCTLAVGVLLLVSPHRTLSVLAVIVGIYLLAVGALWIVASIFVKELRGAALWRGVLALIAGAIVIRHPSDSITVLALAVGIFLLAAGVFELVAAVEQAERRGWRIFEGIVDLAVGVLIISWPQFGVYTFAIVLGIVLLVRGVIEAWLAVMGLRLSRGEHRGSSTLSPA